MPCLELWAETACETGVDLIHLCWRPCWVWRVCRSTPFSAKLRHCLGSCQKTTGLWRNSRHDGISEYFGWWLRETISIYFIFCTSPKLPWDFELPNHPVIECDWQVNADNMISYASFCPRAVPQLQPVGVKSCWRKDFNVWKIIGNHSRIHTHRQVFLCGKVQKWVETAAPLEDEYHAICKSFADSKHPRLDSSVPCSPLSPLALIFWWKWTTPWMDQFPWVWAKLVRNHSSHTIFTEWFASICWGRPLWRMTQALRTSHCANCIMGVQRRVSYGDCYCKYRTYHTALVACLNFILTDFDCCLSRNQLLLICTYLYHLTGNNRKDEEKFYTVLDEASQSPVVLPLSVSACSQWNESPSKTPTKHLDVAEALVNWCLQCFWKFWGRRRYLLQMPFNKKGIDCWLTVQKQSRRFPVAHRWAWQTSWAVWKGLLVAV